MKDTKKGHRNSRRPDPAPEIRMDRLREEGEPGLLSAAVWSAELVPKATGRSFRNSSREEIAENVPRIANRAYLDSQRNECDRTLRYLLRVGKAFGKGLSTNSPTRVEYPNTPASGVR